MSIYEAHGVQGDIVFPITIIEAASDSEAIDKALQDRHLQRHTCPIKLYEVPYFHTGLRAWNEDEMRFVADIKHAAA